MRYIDGEWPEGSRCLGFSSLHGTKSGRTRGSVATPQEKNWNAKLVVGRQKEGGRTEKSGTT